MTTSLKVAEVFGKRHDNVIAEIRKLLERGLLNFQESSYINSQNKSQPMYLMDRKGFVLLAMGFNGDTALQFKSKYIDEFDRMEANTFGKEHKHVMEAIRNLDCPASFIESNFRPYEYEQKVGFGIRKNPMYLMTRDGISEQRCRRNFYGPGP